jgi:hypothetical protein
LLTQDTHDDNTLAFNAVINRMRAVNAASVAGANMINDWIKFGLFGQLGETLLHTVLITQCLINAEGIKAELKDRFEVLVGSTG